MVTSQLKALTSQRNSLTSQFTAAKTDLNTTKNKLDTCLSQLSPRSTTSIPTTTTTTTTTDVSKGLYGGHRYFLSSVMTRNINTFIYHCKMMGGYMVEVDDQQEWDFLLKFIEDHHGFESPSCTFNGRQIQCSMFLGMRDVDNSDTFTNIHSGNPATFFVWGYQMPGTSDGDCVFVQGSDKRMYNAGCVYGNSKARTVCEVDRVA